MTSESQVADQTSQDSQKSTADEDEDLNLETFGPLLSIPPASLTRLASAVRCRVFGVQTLACHIVTRISGSYNLVHVIQLDDFKLVIRVPATGWGAGMTKAAARALGSEVTVMRLIARRTSVPVATVYAFDTSDQNEINAPYICMSYVPGETVSRVWFDEPSLPLSLKSRRLRILESVAQAMAQLSSFTFDKIGSPYEEVDGSLVIDPCYDWNQIDDGSVSILGSGPYDSTAAYLEQHIAPENKKSPWGIAAAKIITAAVPYLGGGVVDRDFVLSVPDFDSQNIMVDHEGNITGIIDWDLAQTVPHCVGYCRYPGWITRDWDPLMYGWPRIDTEDSPEALETYRAYYNENLGDALQRTGDWKFTSQSHIAEAVWIAAMNGPNRLQICRKLVQTVAGEETDTDDILFDLGTERVDEEDWSSLRQKLRQFLS